MATLNIKQFPDPLYKRLRARAKRNHRSLSQEIVHLLEEAEPVRQLSVLDFEGLGKKFWESLGTDAANYIRKERDAVSVR